MKAFIDQSLYKYDWFRKLEYDMILLFNPWLKYLLAEYGLDRFTAYGYNSCRQTAILGAAYISDVIFKDNPVMKEKIRIVELNCDDFVDGVKVKYIHSVIFVDDIIIDLSRTEKPLLIARSVDDCYPDIYPYRQIKINSREEMDLKQYTFDQKEFTTELYVRDLYTELLELIENMGTSSNETILEFSTTIYDKFTHYDKKDFDYIDFLKKINDAKERIEDGYYIE